MPVPAPRFQRIATLVAIDSEHRVALLRTQDSAPPIWELPQRGVGLAESYSESVTRLAGQLMNERSVRSVRWGTITGHLWAQPREGNATRIETRYFIARTSPAARGGLTGGCTFWAPRASLGAFLDAPRFEITSILVDGYLDGWLPDGPITLN
ncbi:hypothetical protein [Streptomyces tubercidicus]|uniref:hypothetical protein n=1 Tax=Streptomyces tubercidicus TaxID=47759 RepID=UPI0036968FAB